MLSRVACNIYWMSRYMERAENAARFVDVNLHLMLDIPVDENRQWAPLIAVTGDQELFNEQYGSATRENVIQFLTFDAEYPSSIISCISKARENARSVREAISSELWRHINETYLYITSNAARRLAANQPNEFFQQIKEQCTLFKGLTDATLTHGEAYHFIVLGRSLERADKTSRIIDVKYFILLPEVNYVNTPYDNIQWAAVLKSASALEMYRIEYQRIEPEKVAGFLILHKNFPRAMRYCVDRAEQAIHCLTGTPADSFGNNAERLLGRMSAELDYADIREIIHSGLHEFLDGFQLKLNHIGDALQDTFFDLRLPGSRPIQQEQHQ